MLPTKTVNPMSTKHTIEPDRATLHGHFSRDLAPCLTIDSGDTVVFATLDAGWNPDPKRTTPPAEDEPGFPWRHREKDAGHALCGPVAVRGAMPGMILEVTIDQLRVGNWGFTLAGGWDHPVYDRLGLRDSKTRLLWSLDSENNVGQDQHGHEVTLRPFLGVMGCAPDEPGILSTAPPRSVGGNMDCKELVQSSRLYLPVAVPGANFSTGDGHAAQGDGEVSGTAIECPMARAELTFRLITDAPPLTFPRANTPAGWVTMGFHEDLNEATYLTLESLIDLMTTQLFPGMSKGEALCLASVAADLRITQIVNGVNGVHAVLPHGAIR